MRTQIPELNPTATTLASAYHGHADSQRCRAQGYCAERPAGCILICVDRKCKIKGPYCNFDNFGRFWKMRAREKESLDGPTHAVLLYTHTAVTPAHNTEASLSCGHGA